MFIYKAAVIGAGAMGAEIAQAITYAGLPVVLKDVDESALNRGQDHIRSIYQRRVDKGKMSAEELESKLALLTCTTNHSGLEDADLVIEAVPEQLPLKLKIFKELGEVCPAGSILASNTSSLSISAMGLASGRPEKVVGIHFFYPAHVMKLVEVIPGMDTAPETLDDAVGFAERLRKLPVRVKECPGFLVNRLLMPYLNEAAYCLQEGAATAEAIDQAMVEFGFPLGPFTLVDQLGLDICHDVVEVLLEGYGPRMEPALIWKRVRDEGRLGAKTGAGFYDYAGGTGDSAWLQQAVTDLKHNTQSSTQFSPERLVSAMANEAMLCLDEHVSSAPEIDLALRAGIGFPDPPGGVLKYADEIGLDVLLERLEQYAQELGPRFWPAPLLRRTVAAGHLGRSTQRGFLDYATATTETVSG